MEDDGEMRQDLFDKNLNNLIERISIHDNDNKYKSIYRIS